MRPRAQRRFIALGNLADSAACSEEIVGLRAMQPLVSLLCNSGSEGGQMTAAAFALKIMLARDSGEMAAQVVSLGALQPLVSMLKRGSDLAKDMRRRER